MEKREFRAESKRLLDLMIHSIYTNKEIFLRELISNASDALDKLAFLGLTDAAVPARDSLEIRLTLDKKNRTLTVSDNGIGMDEGELEENLGVIARSGSRQFREALDSGKPLDAELIGQFGVGFYSAFMVSDRITVRSRKYGSQQAFRWESDGSDGYTVTPDQRSGCGTDVILHIRPDGEEKDEFDRYLREYTIYKLVRKYSNYIRFPIRMLMPQPKIKEGSDKDHPEFEEVFELETFNSMIPIWQRNASELKRKDYNDFYTEHFGDQVAPQRILPIRVEGTINYRALLYIPGHRPDKYRTDEYKSGLELYSAGVLIMESCQQLLPEEFRFVRGVVDTPDLNLNISREMLQQDAQLRRIAANLEKKVRAHLTKLLAEDRPGYERFWKNFGLDLKLEALDNYGAKKEALQDFLLFTTTKAGKPATLAEYTDRMPADQKYIYYAVGPSLEAIERMPQTELLKERGYEILCFTERTDEFVADMFRSYRGKRFRSAADGDLGLGQEVKTDDKAYQELFAFVKEKLGDRVTAVVASGRLKTHPVCLSSGAGITFDMERYFTAVQPELKMKAKRILELNTGHPAVEALEKARRTDPERAGKYAEILYNQALMIAGLPIQDPSAYTDLLCSLWD